MKFTQLQPNVLLNSVATYSRQEIFTTTSVHSIEFYIPLYNTTPTTYSVLCHSKQTKLHTHRINNKQNEKEIKIFILQGFYISLKKARHILLVVIVRAKYNMYKK